MNSSKQKKAVILDFLVPLHITYLRKYFNIKVIGERSRQLNLYSTDPVTGKRNAQLSIHITLSVDFGDNDYIVITYIYNGRLVTQKIELVAKKSSLKKGYWYYFKCPVSNKTCKKLFLYSSQFVSKQAIEGNPMYISQTLSRKQRNGLKAIKKAVRLQKVVDTGKKPYFKKYHAGEPTKRYINVLMAADDLDGMW